MGDSGAAIDGGRGPGAPAAAGGRGRPAVTAARRRGVALAAALALPALLMLAGVWQAWALFAVPVALAVPLAGRPGLAAAASVAALAIALASGRPGADGLALFFAFAAFLGAGLGVGAIHSGRAPDRAGPPATDRLTGLLAAGPFAEALRRECRRARRYGQPLCLALLEPDALAAVAERHGPRARDRLLGRVAMAFRSSLRGSDLAARRGDAQLALLVPGPAEEAIAALERIRTSVAARVLAPPSFRSGVTVSAGLAVYAPDDEDGSDLLARAEGALREAAARGGGEVGVASPAPELVRLTA